MRAEMRRCGYHGLASLVVGVVLTAGCGTASPPVYRDADGVHFTPPPGWVERERPDAVPGARSPAVARNSHVLPLPPLGAPPGSGPERLLVRYDRLSAAAHAWLRLSVADVPAAVNLETCLAPRSPGTTWHREGNIEHLEIAGNSAGRIRFVGRHDDQGYACETVAVRKGERVYFVSASYPASDSTACDEVRQAIAGAAW